MNTARPFLFAFLTLLMMVTPSRSEVYVNMLWDDIHEEFRIQAFVVEGGGVTFDRGYQNAYGDQLGLDPGPPFIVQSSILCSNEYDPDDGTILAFGTITFESGGFDLTQPFNIFMQPADNHEGRISGDGGVNFIGSSLDPITIQGKYLLQAGWTGGTDPRGNGQHSNTWQNTTFHNTFDDYTWNPIPFEIRGGNTTIENCLFSGYDTTFSYLMAYTDVWSQNPVWDLTFKNTRFENMDLDPYPYLISVSDLNSVSIEDCHWAHTEYRPSDASGLIRINGCGLKSIKNNTSSDVSQSSLHCINSWVSDSAFIKTSEELPLLATAINIPEDSALALAPGSLIKWYSVGGFVADGRLWVDGAVMTSINDDRFGGDTDMDPEPSYIQPWNAGFGYQAGISVGPYGHAELKNSHIFYAEGALYAENDVDVDGCRFEHSTGFGFWFAGQAVDTFTVTNTTIAHTTESGYASRYGVMLDNAAGHAQYMLLDNSTLFDVGNIGVFLRSNSGYPAKVDITNCRIINSFLTGVHAESSTDLDSVTIVNSILLGNGAAGINCTAAYENHTVMKVANCLIAGNGDIAAPRYGAIFSSGLATFVNNTVAYNNQAGGVFSQLDEAQSHCINNVFIRNGAYGFSMGDYGAMPVLSNNYFWQNDEDVYEIYFRTPSGVVRTVEDVQALGGDYATNQHADPTLAPEITGPVMAITYDTTREITALVGTAGAFANRTLRNSALNPDTTEGGWYWVVYNTDDTVFVMGDATTVAAAGDGFRLFDPHLADISPLVDAGNAGAVIGLKDFEGQNRVIDGDKNGSAVVDIGGDEYDPDAGYISPIRILQPLAGDFFMEGDTCSILWEADSAGQVRILYSTDYSLEPPPWDTLSHGVDATTGSFDWQVYADYTAKAIIRIEDISNAAVFDQSDPFIIKNWSLARQATDSGLVAYQADVDGWRFGNDSAHMWPAPYYAQFDYENGLDAITGQPYPWYFTSRLYYDAKPSDFPDWPTFVRAFGVDQCYRAVPGGLYYRLDALALWNDIKEEWGGSCVGFGISTSLGFFDSAATVARYPALGQFVDLHDLDSTNGRREVINELFVHQEGAHHQEHFDSNYWKDARAALAELKEILGNNFVNGPMLMIGNVGANGGGHVVTPYELDPIIGQPGKYNVCVYDCNFPLPDLSPAVDTVVIDSAANSWSYHAFPTWTGADNVIHVMDSSASYLRTPVLRKVDDTRMSLATSLPAPERLKVHYKGATDFVAIDDLGNRSGRRADTVWHNIPDAVPRIPLTGQPSPPTGYRLPTGSYRFELASNIDTSIAATIWDGSAIYRYFRDGVAATELDRLDYDTGLAVTNPDGPSRTVNLSFIQVTDERDLRYSLRELTLGGGEQIDVYSSDGEQLHIMNPGAGTAFDFELWSMTGDGVTVVTGDGVALTAGALSTIAPNWLDPELAEIPLLIDYEPDGVYDDTVMLNVVTDVEQGNQSGALPRRFELGQNYPNPFNPSTTITYALPEHCRVSIDVYNILGRHVRTLVDRTQAAGTYSIVWDGRDEFGRDLATGVYLYRLRAGDYTSDRKMLLLK